MAIVLISGAAGYIGSVLCPALLEAGHHVIAVDNFRYGAQQATSLAACCHHRDNFDLYRIDVRDHKKMAVLYAAADVVIPLAALVGAPLCDLYPDEAQQLHVAEMARIAWMVRGEALVIYPNTNSSYGSMPEG